MGEIYELTTNVLAEYQHPSGYINIHGGNNPVQTLGHQGESKTFTDNNNEYEVLYNFDDSETAELVLFESNAGKRGEGIKKLTIYKPQASKEE